MEQRLENEIEHGRFLAERGAGEIWNWESPAGRRRWARRVDMLVGHLQHGMRVLELGCGTGYFTSELVKTGARITAIDISPELLELARRQVPEENATFVIENAYATSFAGGCFDSVVGSSVLHHLDVDRALAEIFRVLKPGGTVRFTEPNMGNPQIAIQKNVPAIKARLGDSPDETAFFRWALDRDLRRHGFVETDITPFDFLHPKTPTACVATLERLGMALERVPLLREIAGSLYIRASKPNEQRESTRVQARQGT